MSLLEFIYSLTVLGMGFFLGWGLHDTRTEDKAYEYKRKLTYAEYEISELIRENRKLRLQVSVLNDDLISLRKGNATYTQGHKESPEVKEAVKYAMKSAHPDNGGDAKDFVKFRELYNKIK